jgi:hypothetical protein
MRDSTEEQLRLWAEGVLQIVLDPNTLQPKLWNPETGIWVIPTDGFESVRDQLRDANLSWHRSRYDRQ